MVQIGDEHGWDLVIQGLAIAHQRELHDDVGRAYANLVSSSVHYRRYNKAKAWLDEGLAYMEEHELDSYRVYLLGWRATLYFHTGQWALVEATANQALKLHTGTSVLPIPALTVLGHLKVRRGDPDAEAWLEQDHRLSVPGLSRLPVLKRLGGAASRPR